jgi:hypothetical protein
MSGAARAAALVLLVAVTALGAGAATAQSPAPPLTATIFFTPGPGVPADGVFAPGAPIPITIQIENTGAATVPTTQGFADSEFFRRLYFVDPNGGIVTNKIEETTHGDSRYATCLSRRGVLLSPGIPLVPIELLNGTSAPTPFFREYQIPDARAFYDLSRPGRYTVNAQIPLLVIALSDASAIVTDCDQVPGTNANVASVSGRTAFTIVSNTLAFEVNGTAPLPPATTATVSPAAGVTGWHTQAATVTFDAVSPPPGSPPGTPGVPIQRIVVETSGAQPGTTTIPDKQGSVPVGAEGQTTVTYHAEDIAGNIETPQALTVKVDRTPPVITVTTPAGGAAYVQGASVLAQYACTDATSGVATCAGPVSSGSAIDTATPGPKSFTVSATDVAGNAAAPVTVSYTVQASDTVAPTTQASPAPPPNANGWNNGRVVVTLTATDNAGGSGVKRITYWATGAQTIAQTSVNRSSTTVSITAEGTTTLKFFATDNANNAEAQKTLTVRIDKTKPVISGLPAPGCSIWPPDKKLVQIANVTATDALSGLPAGALSVTVTSNEPTKPGDIVVSGGVVRVVADRAGSGNGRVYTVTATATDRAGNVQVATGTCRVPHDQGDDKGRDKDDKDKDGRGKDDRDKDDKGKDDKGKDKDDRGNGK